MNRLKKIGASPLKNAPEKNATAAEDAASPPTSQLDADPLAGFKAAIEQIHATVRVIRDPNTHPSMVSVAYDNLAWVLRARAI